MNQLLVLYLDDEEELCAEIVKRVRHCAAAPTERLAQPRRREDS